MTSETVERLQISGTLIQVGDLGGGEVPGLTIETDWGLLEVRSVRPDLLAAMPMLLYRRVTLTVEAEIQFVPAAALDDAEPRFGPITSDPADAERNIRAKEDPERAEYLKRWEDAPEDAKHMAQDPNGRCWWVDRMPFQSLSGYWDGAIFTRAGDNLLGSTRCEPRPKVQP